MLLGLAETLNRNLFTHLHGAALLFPKELIPLLILSDYMSYQFATKLGKQHHKIQRKLFFRDSLRSLSTVPGEHGLQTAITLSQLWYYTITVNCILIPFCKQETEYHAQVSLLIYEAAAS